MKKNSTMRIAAVLMVLTLMTSCFVGGTFAKYTTSGYAEDTARVAKWGITVSADGTNTFGGAYKKANDNTLSATYDVNTETVNSTGGDVVAPGTKGTVAGLVINGTAEVNTMVTFKAEVTLANWDVSGYYCPLVFTVTTTKDGVTTETPIYGSVYGSADEFEAAIEAEVLKAQAIFAANASINDDSLTITWEWPFSTGEVNDVKDTELGRATTPAKVTIKVTATVEQTD